MNGYMDLPLEEQARIELFIDEYIVGGLKKKYAQHGLDADWRIIDVIYTGSIANKTDDEYTVDYDIIVLVDKVILYESHQKKAYNYIKNEASLVSVRDYGLQKFAQLHICDKSYIYDYPNGDPRKNVGFSRTTGTAFAKKREVLDYYG